jgi:hypothetical protein
MSKSPFAALRFCLSRNRLLTLPSGEILYFPLGNWLNGRKTNRIWQFVLIDNLRILAWQIVLFAIVAIIFVWNPPLYWLGAAGFLPVIEIVALSARWIWVKPAPISYSYVGAIRMIYDRYPAVYKSGGFMWAPFGRRIPIVLLIFAALILLLLGGFIVVDELSDIYCRLGACIPRKTQADYTSLAYAVVMLFFGGAIFVFDIRGEPVSLPVNVT